MKFRRVTLRECSQAAGVVVVIDVCRAFTTAAYAFAGGVREILLTGKVEEALALRKAVPDSLVMGEVNGLPVEGFDLWNSPSELAGRNLHGKTLIQRTTAGTQGMVLSKAAEVRLAASFAVAKATARWIIEANPPEVTFVITGIRETGEGGLEDAACADYMTDLLSGKDPSPTTYMGWAVSALAGLKTRMKGHEAVIEADLALCQKADLFDFVMLAEVQNERLILRAKAANGVS